MRKITITGKSINHYVGDQEFANDRGQDGSLSYVQRPGRSRERYKRKKEGRPWITGRNVSVQYGVAVVELIVNAEE